MAANAQLLAAQVGALEALGGGVSRAGVGALAMRWPAPSHQRPSMERETGFEPATLGLGSYRAIHSDQGTFTSWAFTQRAIDSGLLPLVGPVGDCGDNTIMKSFWIRMQVELLDLERWKTRVDLANAIFEYLAIFHNRRRRHSSLGMVSPMEYEARHAS